MRYARLCVVYLQNVTLHNFSTGKNGDRIYKPRGVIFYSQCKFCGFAGVATVGRRTLPRTALSLPYLIRLKLVSVCPSVCMSRCYIFFYPFLIHEAPLEWKLIACSVTLSKLIALSPKLMWIFPEDEIFLRLVYCFETSGFIININLIAYLFF